MITLNVLKKVLDYLIIHSHISEGEASRIYTAVRNKQVLLAKVEALKKKRFKK